MSQQGRSCRVDHRAAVIRDRASDAKMFPIIEQAGPTPHAPSSNCSRPRFSSRYPAPLNPVRGGWRNRSQAGSPIFRSSPSVPDIAASETPSLLAKVEGNFDRLIARLRTVVTDRTLHAP